MNDREVSLRINIASMTHMRADEARRASTAVAHSTVETPHTSSTPQTHTDGPIST
jgi:hypothetical protein